MDQKDKFKDAIAKAQRTQDAKAQRTLQDVFGIVGHLQDTVLAHAKSLKTMQEEAEFNRRQRQRTQVELDRRQKQIEQLEDRARHLEHMFDGCGMPIPNADLVPLSGAVCWTTFWTKTCQVFHGKLPHLVVDLLIDVGIFPAEVKRRLYREEVRDD